MVDIKVVADKLWGMFTFYHTTYPIDRDRLKSEHPDLHDRLWTLENRLIIEPGRKVRMETMKDVRRWVEQVVKWENLVCEAEDLLNGQGQVGHA